MQIKITKKRYKNQKGPLRDANKKHLRDLGEYGFFCFSVEGETERLEKGKLGKYSAYYLLVAVIYCSFKKG